MIIRYTEEEYNEANYKSLLKLECETCHDIFFKYKQDINRVLSGKTKTWCRFCSISCQRKVSNNVITRICSNCNSPVTRHVCEMRKAKYNVFCNRSCAASYNNRINPKRPNFRKCKKCGTSLEVNFRKTYCSSCTNKKSEQSAARTLKDFIGRRNYQIHSQIRQEARVIYRNSNKPKFCVNCRYNKHYEVCHVKAIRDFPKDTLVSDINSLDNLIALCPNCHWEFDRGLLILSAHPVGIEPTFAASGLW